MRKTITLPESIENAVRNYQMAKMRVDRRDVSFTESLVSMVALGVAAIETITNEAVDDAVKLSLLMRWREIDRSDESRWGGVADAAYEAAAEWIQRSAGDAGDPSKE